MTTTEPDSPGTPPWYNRASDFFNAILIKESRQAFKSRQFVTIFMLLLAISWVVSVFGLLNSGDALEYGSVGPDFFYRFYIVLAFATVLVVPFNAFRSLLSERDLNTYDLLSITTLSPKQIVWGKLLSSVVQLFVFYSAVTPFIAFASLMQGFSAPTAAYILVATMLASVFLSMAALMLSTFARHKALQGLVTVVVLSGLVSAFFQTAWLVYEVIDRDTISVADPEFWWRTGFVLAALASYFILFQKITITQLTFEADNRSTGIRVVTSCQFWLLWAAYGGFVLIRQQPMDPIVVQILAIVSALHWSAVGLFLTTEEDFLSRRVHREIPRRTIWRWLKGPFLPGGARGYLFVLLHLVALWLIVVLCQAVMSSTTTEEFQEFYAGLFNLRSSSWTVLVRITTAVCCYAAVYLGIATAMGRWGRSVSTDVKPAHVRILTVLLFTAGFIFPLLLRATETIKGNQYTLFDITAPKSTLDTLAARIPSRHAEIDLTDPVNSLRQYVKIRGLSEIVLVLLMLAALTAALVNARAMITGVSGLSSLVRCKPDKEKPQSSSQGLESGRKAGSPSPEPNANNREDMRLRQNPVVG
ncbi:MAG: ABC transporter permease, partial [Planctomycetes bacterium]|nr:ABC transporter permease [Planctomycetota bacterium]